jgi:predicted Fe-Mo cluster-binding NifX family protein
MADKQRDQSDFPKTSEPATDALFAAGYKRLEDLTKATEAEILGLHGMGPKAMRILKAAMAERNMTFATEDLPKISGPATRALHGAGYKRLEDLTKATEAEIMALHGMGPKAMGILKAAMAERGLAFKSNKGK